MPEMTWTHQLNLTCRFFQVDFESLPITLPYPSKAFEGTIPNFDSACCGFNSTAKFVWVMASEPWVWLGCSLTLNYVASQVCPLFSRINHVPLRLGVLPKSGNDSDVPQCFSGLDWVSWEMCLSERFRTVHYIVRTVPNGSASIMWSKK